MDAREVAQICDDLQRSPPLPLVPVVWKAGWFDGALGSSQAATLTTLRRNLMGLYLGQIRALKDGMVQRGAELESAASLYLTELKNLCAHSGERAGKQRTFPLVVEWMFAELDHDKSKPVCMVETMPAMEYLVIAGGVCVLQHGKGRQLQLQDEFAAAIDMYSSCTQLVRAYSAQFFGNLVSRRQWAKIRRSNLALQMTPMWWGMLADASRHNAQICAVLREERGPCADRYTRGCYDTLSRVVSSVRRLLVEQKFLNPYQRALLQASYEAHVAHLQLWHAERLRCEAAAAIDTYETDIAHELLAQCTTAMQNAPDNPTLRQTVQDMQKQVRQCSTGAYAVVDDAQCQRWRTTLPPPMFAIPPF